MLHLVNHSAVTRTASAVVGISQELFLVRNDLRQRVRVQCSVLGLVRKTGSGLGKQRHHLIEARLVPRDSGALTIKAAQAGKRSPHNGFWASV